jgi:hypothetical protein
LPQQSRCCSLSPLCSLLKQNLWHNIYSADKATQTFSQSFSWYQFDIPWESANLISATWWDQGPQSQ